MCCNSFVQIESAAGLPSLYIPACFLEYRKKDLTPRVGEKHWIWAADSLQQRLHSRYKQLCKFCSGIAHGRSCRSALQANCESFKFFQQKYTTTTSFSALSRLHAVQSVCYEVSSKRQSYLETMLASKISFPGVIAKVVPWCESLWLGQNGRSFIQSLTVVCGAETASRA